jgi:hypothetical protein
VGYLARRACAGLGPDLGDGEGGEERRGGGDEAYWDEIRLDLIILISLFYMN